MQDNFINFQAEQFKLRKKRIQLKLNPTPLPVLFAKSPINIKLKEQFLEDIKRERAELKLKAKLLKEHNVKKTKFKFKTKNKDLKQVDSDHLQKQTSVCRLNTKGYLNYTQQQSAESVQVKMFLKAPQLSKISLHDDIQPARTHTLKQLIKQDSFVEEVGLDDNRFLSIDALLLQQKVSLKQINIKYENRTFFFPVKVYKSHYLEESINNFKFKRTTSIKLKLSVQYKATRKCFVYLFWLYVAYQSSKLNFVPDLRTRLRQHYLFLYPKITNHKELQYVMSDAITVILLDQFSQRYDYIALHQFVSFELSGVEVKQAVIKLFVTQFKHGCDLVDQEWPVEKQVQPGGQVQFHSVKQSFEAIHKPDVVPKQVRMKPTLISRLLKTVESIKLPSLPQVDQVNPLFDESSMSSNSSDSHDSNLLSVDSNQSDCQSEKPTIKMMQSDKKLVVKQLVPLVIPDEDAASAPYRKRFLKVQYPPSLTPTEASKFVLSSKKEIQNILLTKQHLDQCKVNRDVVFYIDKKPQLKPEKKKPPKPVKVRKRQISQIFFNKSNLIAGIIQGEHEASKKRMLVKESVDAFRLGRSRSHAAVIVNEQ